VRSPGRRRLTPILAAGILLIAACAGNNDAEPPPSTTAPSKLAPTTSAAAQTENERVLAQYGGFFQTLPQASTMPEAPRNELLAKYLSGSAYSKTVKTLSSQAAFGKVVYGEVIMHPDVTSIDTSTAVVTDCQDTSNSGVKDRKTGRKETKGIPRALVVADLRAVGGTWKIIKIDYRGARC
jgi:hypothetical protein